ncbi:MAG TPA: EAL domain-containing protein [Sphingomonas sp.]|nr:EAL domain-containing protein [Sphingomonas sp.]
MTTVAFASAIGTVARSTRIGRGLLRHVHRLERALGVAVAGSIEARLGRAIDAVEQRLGDTVNRVDQRHSLTGLPTREPLIARMAQDGNGLLGVIGIADFDRLCAFDPALGERVLLSVIDRFARMLPAERLVAHVDRSVLAIWFGPDIEPAAAQAELDVIGYALGDAIVEDGRKILPEIRVRQAVYTAGGSTPQSVLARTLSSLTLDHAAMAIEAAPAIDPAAIAGDRYALEQDLRQAIERGQLQMCYQPLVDAAAGRVCGAESLIRWHHPVRGFVPPSRFVPIMEKLGLAHEIGMWTLNVASREARHWQTEGLAGLRVAVNVSGHQLQRDDLPALVERALTRHSLSPEALEIELTESVAMGDGDLAARLFAALRAMGVRIAIDDFGTGFSSFSTLRTLSFDKIKIDREFVTNVDTRRDSQAICQSIVALGRGLGIRVLAEGVERRGEYEWLRRHGCTHFQGYYFAPPLDGAGFVAFVRDQASLATLLAIDSAPAHRISERLTA